MRSVYGTRNNYRYKILVVENLRKSFTCNSRRSCTGNIKNNITETVDKAVF